MLLSSFLVSFDSGLAMSSTLTNSERSESTVIGDTNYWLTRINRQHFTYLNDESKERVKVQLTLDEFFKLGNVHQDHFIYDTISYYIKKVSVNYFFNRLCQFYIYHIITKCISTKKDGHSYTSL